MVSEKLEPILEDVVHTHDENLHVPMQTINIITEDDIGKRCRIENYDCEGVLRFVGKHATKKGLRCGIELDKPVGNNNGTVNGHEYFKTEENKGILCVPKKVTLI